MERTRAVFLCGMLAIVGTLPLQAIAAAPSSASGCTNCGVVESVHAVKVKGEGSGVGAVAGAVVGGVVGHQFGRGRGNTLATVAGAGGGAYAGHQIERNVKSHTEYKVKVRMDDGSYRTFSYAQAPSFTQGSRVQVVDGKLRAGP